MKVNWKLTAHEENVLLPLAVQLLKKRTNKNVFSNPEICAILSEFSDSKVHDSQIRKLVFNIRQRNLIPLLIANSEGYYKGTNLQEIKIWIERHKSKMEAMRSTLESLEYQLEEQLHNLNDEDNDLNGQLSIFDIID